MNNTSNIYSSQTLFDWAKNGKQSYQATIQPSGTQVMVTVTETDPGELSFYAKLLNSGIREKWISKSHNGGFDIVNAGTPLRVPKICISARLATFPHTWESKVPLAEDDFVYILIIEGRNAAQEAKVVTRYSRSSAADVMIHEALNGYSTVFSGCILRHNLERGFGQALRTWIFEQVPDPDRALDAENSDQTEKTIAVIC